MSSAGTLKKRHASEPRAQERVEEVEQSVPPTPGAADAGVLDAGILDAGVDAQADLVERVAPTPVKHAGGREIEGYLLANEFLRPYVERRLQHGVRVEGHIHEHEPAQFHERYMQYMTHRINGATGKYYTKEEARAKEHKTNAFRDESEIHVHKYRGDFTTTIHESIHLYSSENFTDHVPSPAVEGVTEFFAMMVCEQQGLPRGGVYGKQLASVQKLVALVSQKTLAEAYFNGQVEALRKAVDDAKGPGTFQQWLLLMKKREYKDADKVL